MATNGIHKKKQKQQQRNSQTELTEVSTPQSPVAAATGADQEMLVVSLLFSASKGDLGGVQRALGTGKIDPSTGDYDKRTALHLAASEGHLSVVQYLINQGANVNAQDRFGGAPIDDAIRHGHQEITNLLIENGAERPSLAFELELISAASSGNAEIVKRLLANKVNPNCSDYDKRTPLHLAAASHNEEIVQLLIDAGADVNAVDRWDGTPLSDAVRSGTRLGDDRVVALLKKATEATGHALHTPFYRDPFILLFIFIEVVILILHAIFSEYNAPGANNLHRYPMFQDVNVMIFIGFGFLMTFLRKYGYSAVGFNFVIAAFVLQWYPLLRTFWGNIVSSTPSAWDTPVYIDVSMLLFGEFCAGAVLITFGALLGKTSLTQMMFIALTEPIFYALNEAIANYLQIADVGGSMVIHAFGAFFGLAASRVLTPRAARGPSDNAAVYHSDLFSMIGTIFLWLFWPSFNAAFADGDGTAPEAQNRAIVNTLLSLTASTVVAFLCSYWMRGHNKLFMVDIQNATLAGGVSMGASANMFLHPATALAIGMVAGAVSVFGFSTLQGVLERTIGLHDTCGVLNLHGMPGFLGGTWSAIAAATTLQSNYFDTIEAKDELAQVFPGISAGTYTASKQGGLQFAFLMITLGISITSGAVVGFICTWPILNPAKKFFLDSAEWEVPELEKPYFFDKRGENTHASDAREGKALQEMVLETKHNQAPVAELDTRVSSLEGVVRRLQQQGAAQAPYGFPGGFAPGFAPAFHPVYAQEAAGGKTVTIADLSAKLDALLSKLA